MGFVFVPRKAKAGLARDRLVIWIVDRLDQSVPFEESIRIRLSATEGGKQDHRVEGVSPGEDVFSKG